MLGALFRSKAALRYIDIHGRPQPVTGVADHVLTPDTGTGLTITAASAAFAMLAQGASQDEVFIILGFGLFGTAFSNVITGFASHRLTQIYRQAHNTTLADYAIDTDGRSEPPRDNHTLLSQTEFHQRMNDLFSGGLALIGISAGAATTAADFLNNPFFITASSAMIAACMARFLYQSMICRRILNGAYTFCGTTPRLS